MPVPTGSLFINHYGQVYFLNLKAVVLIVRQPMDMWMEIQIRSQKESRYSHMHKCMCKQIHVTACCMWYTQDTLAHMCSLLMDLCSRMYCFPGPFLGVHFPKCQVSISPSHLPNWISCGQGPLNKCTSHLDLLEENKRCFSFWEGIILMHANMQRQNACELSG